MTASATQLAGHQLEVAAQKYKFYLRVYAQLLAIFFLEHGTGNHGRLICLKTAFDDCTHFRQPGLSILVGERATSPHLLAIAGWMKIVPIVKRPTQLAREHLAHGCLAGAGHAANDHYHKALSRLSGGVDAVRVTTALLFVIRVAALCVQQSRSNHENLHLFQILRPYPARCSRL